MITPQQIKELKELTREERKLVCRHNFGLFFIYYFWKYVGYEFAPFHYEMVNDLHDLTDRKIRELAWIQFRESGKTSFAKAYLVYLLCYRVDEYINVDSYDKENAERILFDIVWELQTNKRILDDFGSLYNAPKSKDLVQQKRVSNFITNAPPGQTGVRVEAHSTQEPVRGRLHGSVRPQLILLDDFETKKTIKSEEYTRNVREHIQEFKGGLDSVRGRVLYLGNYLSEFANIQSIIDRSKVDENLRIRIVPIEDGKPTWPQKYTNTNEPNKVSIESIRQMMWTPETLDDDFMAEMMCQPIDYSNAEFKREWFSHRYITPDLKDLDLKTTICFDNAPSTNEHSDWTGCTVVSIDVRDNWYIRYVKRYKLNTPDLIEELFRLWDEYKPHTIGIEQKAFEDLIQPYIEKRSKELKKYPYVVELKDKGYRKEDRIRGRLQGRFKAGMIKLAEYPIDDTQAMIKEFAQFPHGKFDDLIDSLQYHVEIAYAPRPATPWKPVTPTEHKVADIKSAYERYQKRGEVSDTI